METKLTVELISSRLGHMQDGSTLIRAKLHFIFLAISGISLVISLLADSDKSAVILVIKELNNVIFVLTIHAGFKGVHPLCDTIEAQSKRNFVERILPDTKRAKAEINKEINKILQNSKRVLIAVFIMYNFFPLFQTIFILITEDADRINIQKLPFVFYFYYFSYNSSLKLYFIVTVMQVVCSGTTIVLLYCVFNSGFIAVRSLVFEIKMTCQCMTIINEHIVYTREMCDDESEHMKRLFRNYSTKPQTEASLKTCMHDLIMQHQCISNDLKVVDKGLQNFILACNNSFGIQICMSIYCIREMDGFFMKLEYSILLIWIVWIMELYSALGQQVTDEGENLRLALCHCNWLDSPDWCKRSLLIMMIRATKKMEIKPYGLSVLNLRSFTHVINAAYSYFNLLQKLK